MDRDPDYRALQQHLDRQPVGFPATRSGAEIRILKHIFTPHEARIAACLSYRPAPLVAIHARAAHLVASVEELARRLDGLVEKGGIEVLVVDGERRYANAPLVVGMYELQVDRLTPSFLVDFRTYTSDPRFAVAFLSTHLPQMRTIPIAKSLRPRLHVSDFDQAASLLRSSEGPFVLLDCICRKQKAMQGEACRVTDRSETCLGMGPLALTVLAGRVGREVGREEALGVLERNQREGLVLQPSNTVRADFICSCCGCCCGMLSMQRVLPKPLTFWASNFHAVVDDAACDGCGACLQRCQVEAIKLRAGRPPASVDRNRCIGCGHCVAVCTKGAVSLAPKKTLVRPPETREVLHETLAANRKGSLGKWRLAGRLLLDALSTRSTRFWEVWRPAGRNGRS